MSLKSLTLALLVFTGSFAVHSAEAIQCNPDNFDRATCTWLLQLLEQRHFGNCLIDAYIPEYWDTSDLDNPVKKKSDDIIIRVQALSFEETQLVEKKGVDALGRDDFFKRSPGSGYWLLPDGSHLYRKTFEMKVPAKKSYLTFHFESSRGSNIRGSYLNWNTYYHSIHAWYIRPSSFGSDRTYYQMDFGFEPPTPKNLREAFRGPYPRSQWELKTLRLRRSDSHVELIHHYNNENTHTCTNAFGGKTVAWGNPDEDTQDEARTNQRNIGVNGIDSEQMKNGLEHLKKSGR